MHVRISQAAAVIVVLALLITGCTSQASNIGIAKDKRNNNVVDTGFVVSSVGSYDSADTAVVMSTDQQNNSVTFMNMDTGRQYTLYYDGTTYGADYMHITLIDEDDIPEAMAKLRAIYHNLMILSYDNTRTRHNADNLNANDVENMSPLALFAELFEKQNGVQMSDEQTEFMTKLIESVWEDKD